uniref:Uncharacterized protein n=1 Tax=Arundo donax TaxID=35708 RepID=A0A0A9B111_ARUDO
MVCTFQVKKELPNSLNINITHHNNVIAGNQKEKRS